MALMMYGKDGAALEADHEKLEANVVWMDLLDATAQEILLVERVAGIEVPSREALSEIEASSRLVRDDDHLYLSSPVLGKPAGEGHSLTPAGFVVGPKILVTIRYDELPSFDSVATRMETDETLGSGFAIFVALLESIVERVPTPSSICRPPLKMSRRRSSAAISKVPSGREATT